jgi:uncharacterized OB-fold protein
MSPLARGPAVRVLPQLDELNRFFWTSGADGVLRVLRCLDCGTWLHPPAPRCFACLGDHLAPVATSGRGLVHSFTVNVKEWVPGSEPYVIGLVELADAPGVRLTTNLVDCEPEELALGMPVEVVFEPCDDVWLPLFRPVRDASGTIAHPSGRAATTDEGSPHRSVARAEPTEAAGQRHGPEEGRP